MTKDKYNVFISYSRNDYKDSNNEPIPNNVISKITSAFKKNHITYWIDEAGIYTGDNFAPKIAEAIKSSSIFVFVSTENSNQSQWTQNEISVAQAYKKPILPIKCDDSTYATSVIMYLAMLDYCDYKNAPESAIEQLVDSVKDKLPHDIVKEENTRLGGDDKYKEIVINSLTEINHQFVDISQIAISQVLEANERSCKSIEELRSYVGYRSDTFNQLFQEHLNKLYNLSESNTLQLCDIIKDLIIKTEQTNKHLDLLCNLLKSQTDKNNTMSLPPIIANIIFVIDVSGSMTGRRIDTLNIIMNRLINSFDELYTNTHNISFRLSVLLYSSTVKWMNNYVNELDGFQWVNLEASGLTNLGLAIDKLKEKLTFKNGILSEIDKTTQPIIIFMCDGNPTDDWERSLREINENVYFHFSHKRVIALGDDVSIDLLSKLSYQGVIKTKGDFDVEYALSDIISGYINEISTHRNLLHNFISK